jgi:hypothetical protein
MMYASTDALQAQRIGPGDPGGYTNQYVAVLGDVMVLSNDYPKEQLWFSFMNGCVLNRQNPRYSGKLWTWADNSRARAAKTDLDEMNAFPSDFYTLLPDELDVPQRVLPFKEFQRVQDEDLSGLFGSDFASFDRDADGKKFVFRYNHSEEKELLEWLAETCQGRYATYNSHVYIEREEDALSVRLRVS